VALDRGRAEKQGLGHGGVGAAGRDQAQDVDLPWGQEVCWPSGACGGGLRGAHRDRWLRKNLRDGVGEWPCASDTQGRGERLLPQGGPQCRQIGG
jgi:hypothetical protein